MTADIELLALWASGLFLLGLVTAVLTWIALGLAKEHEQTLAIERENTRLRRAYEEMIRSERDRAIANINRETGGQP